MSTPTLRENGDQESHVRCGRHGGRDDSLHVQRETASAGQTLVVDDDGHQCGAESRPHCESESRLPELDRVVAGRVLGQRWGNTRFRIVPHRANDGQPPVEGLTCEVTHFQRRPKICRSPLLSGGGGSLRARGAVSAESHLLSIFAVSSPQMVRKWRLGARHHGRPCGEWVCAGQAACAGGDQPRPSTASPRRQRSRGTPSRSKRRSG